MAGFFKKLVSGLTKTRDNIVHGIDNVFSGFSKIDDDFYEELEETLIMGDIGVRATDEIIEELKSKVKENKIKDPKDCKQLLIDTIREKMNLGPNAYDFENQKSIVMLIGVNGVGKTTSVGKLAGHLKAQNKKVIMAAADTFRAAAIEQLTEWSNRVGVDIIAQSEGSDPAAVIYDSIAAAKARHADVLLCDTAGRLQNKKNLMEELRKIDRVIEREYSDAYRENLIVLDATTGQNALSQLREFNDVTNITGIILTKMDGTAKGGIAVAIQAEFGIPVKYVGVGEKVEDLQKFDSDTFVNALFDVATDDEDEEPRRRHGFWLLVTTAIATSLDAMAVGVGLAFLQVNIIATALAIGCATLIMSTLGMMVGRFIGSIIGKKAEILGGLVLIGIGVQILWTHFHG